MLMMLQNMSISIKIPYAINRYHTLIGFPPLGAALANLKLNRLKMNYFTVFEDELALIIAVLLVTTSNLLRLILNS